MSGQGGLHGDLGGFQVADLADHDHIRVLAQDRAQRGGEGQTDLGVGLDLGDGGNPVFDRVLHRDDLAHAIVDRFEGGVEGRRLARAGRAGHQDDAVGLVDPGIHHFQVIRQQPQAIEAQALPLLRQQAHDHRLAMHAGQGRYPHVHVLAADPRAHASVLGKPPLGDVDAGHQLDPRHDGGETLARQCQAGLQHAVDTKADVEVEFPRLDVDVRGAVFDGLPHDVADQFDDRRLLGHFPQMADIVIGEQSGIAPFLLLPFTQVFEPGVEVLRTAQHRLQLPSRIEITQGVLQRRRQGIAGSEQQSRIRVLPDHHLLGDEPVEPDRRAVEKVRYRGIARRRQVHPEQRHGQLLGQHVEQCRFGNDARAHQDRPQPAAQPGLQLQRPLHFLRAGQPALDQAPAQRRILFRQFGGKFRAHRRTRPACAGTKAGREAIPAMTRRGRP
ncbi:hypothetical protein D9M71_128340 [compost metagenome]